MKIAVISDIHGNLEAFLAVYADMNGADVDEIICLGDVVGYGPDPEAVVQKLRELKIPTTMGNHELALSNENVLRWFNRAARDSLEKTRGFLSDASIHYIRDLPTSVVAHGGRFVHGFPPDLVRKYLFQVSDKALDRTFREMAEAICFIGHTHLLKLVRFDGNTVTERPLNNGITEIDTDLKYIVNIGSVGQPRDGNNKAKYVLWDIDKRHLELRYVPYDIETVFNKIIARGLPETHARRLR